MRFFNWGKKSIAAPAEVKSASYFFGLGSLMRTQTNYEGLASEGYGLNPVVRACVDRIAQSVASVDIYAYKTDKNGKQVKVENHPLVKLLGNPNPAQSGDCFIAALVRYYLIAGNAFVYGLGLDYNSREKPSELYLYKPSAVRVVKGERVFPSSYEYRDNSGTTINYAVSKLTGFSAVKHFKMFNPIDELVGLSPMTSALLDIDVSNEGSKHNLRLLQNGCRPSGAMVVKGEQGQPKTLSEDQYARLRDQIDNQFSGSNNAARPMLLEGGLEWQEMSVNARDMDFENSMNKAARQIALVYGVPPQLLGIKGDATYANMAEAKLALWTDTVLPLLHLILEELTNWLAPLYSDNVTLWYDEDMIPALEPLRQMKAQRIEASTTMTINEKRRAMGLEDVAGGDEILVDSGKIPLALVGDMGLSETGAVQ